MYVNVSIRREFNGQEYDLITSAKSLDDFKVGSELDPSISAQVYLAGGKNIITAVEEMSSEDYYIVRLKGHDWTFAYSDDRRVFTRGDAERKYLNSLQKSVDKDFSIWNQHCHAMFIHT